MKSAQSWFVRCVVLVAAVLTLGACGTVSVRTTLNLPAKAAPMRQQNGVVVLPVGGPNGANVTSMLRNAVLSSRFHKLVQIDGGQAQRLVNELEAGTAATSLADQFPQGTTAVIYGAVEVQYRPVEKSSQQQRCVSTDAQGRCTKQVPITVYELNEFCDVAIKLQAVHLQTGATAKTRGTDGGMGLGYSGENEHPRGDRAKVCGMAFGIAAKDLTQWFVPHSITRDLDFHAMSSDGGLTDDAIKAFSRREFKDALDTFGAVPSAVKGDQLVAWAHFNLGLCYLGAQQYGKCVVETKAANAVLHDSDVHETAAFCAQYQ